MSQLTDTVRRHHKSEPATSQTLRYLKVGYVSRRHADRHDMTRYYSRSPSLHLTGSWLEAAGFGTDTPVIVTVEQGQLVIRAVAE
ncbi:SymE family type I addiction module toxin [Pectobacterium versatile]|uniref:Type I toxin-antitoxin system SymE family toxin n=1 Tax=Pectobacterium versatile TaxID=2488639 RepID=A0AAW3RQZ9_9GAMM|nr:SymE family type I addiction module toxin [Pectobacterium versatile]MBA0158870.1 type I toxin-antitoxin system SymE family toxin [Pectobacterium versatile]MCA6937215.1 type I toxin-antitoxin system SymE family toxin [Pectobacterium versatile]